MLNLEKKSKLFKALGDPIRLKIIDHLLKKGCCTCICELSKILKRDQSVVFRHVMILKEVDLVNTNKDARFLMCCIKNRAKLIKILEV